MNQTKQRPLVKWRTGLRYNGARTPFASPSGLRQIRRSFYITRLPAGSRGSIIRHPWPNTPMRLCPINHTMGTSASLSALTTLFTAHVPSFTDFSACPLFEIQPVKSRVRSFKDWDSLASALIKIQPNVDKARVLTGYSTDLDSVPFFIPQWFVTQASFYFFA